MWVPVRSSDSQKLSLCSVFNGDVTISVYIASNDCMIVNNELETMWKETLQLGQSP
jgi:hypothetical protein